MPDVLEPAQVQDEWWAHAQLSTHGRHFRCHVASASACFCVSQKQHAAAWPTGLERPRVVLTGFASIKAALLWMASPVAVSTCPVFSMAARPYALTLFHAWGARSTYTVLLAISSAACWPASLGAGLPSMVRCVDAVVPVLLSRLSLGVVLQKHR